MYGSNVLRVLWKAVRASLRRIWAVVVKEVLVTASDKGSRAILIVPVLVQTFLFGYGATFNLERVPWVLLDESRSAMSSEIVRRIDGNGVFERVGTAISQEAWIRLIDEGDALLGIRFASDFEKTGVMLVAADARNSTTAGVAQGYIAQIVERVNRDLAEKSGSAANSVRILMRDRWNENGYTRYGILSGLIVGLTMIQVMLLSALSVTREREEGSFDMMLMTPAKSWEILIGKGVFPTAAACFQGFVIFLVGYGWFELPFSGRWFTMSILVGGFAVSFVGVGLAISAVAKSVQQAVVAVIFTLLPSFILSGILTSTLAMPSWMRVIAEFNPVKCAVDAVRMVYFQGAGLAEVLPGCWPLGAVAAVSLVLAVRLFRNKIS